MHSFLIAKNETKKDGLRVALENLDLRATLEVAARLFVVTCLLFSASSAYAADATLYLSPPAGIYTVNEHAMVRVFVSSDGAPVYGVEGVLVFDPKKMSVVSVSHEASVLTSWPTPPSFDNEKGEIYFGGVLSTSTVLDRGHIFSIVIMPLRAEDFRLAFASGAAILAADGTGGNIVSTLKLGDYTGIPTGEYVTPLESIETPSGDAAEASAQDGAAETPEIIPAEATTLDTVVAGAEGIADNGEVLGTSTQMVAISSPSHPDQDAWYALTTSTITWDMPEGVTRVRLALNKNPDGEGLVLYNAPTKEKVIDGIPEGIQYFHLTREWSDGHTDSATYRIQTDTTAPLNMSLVEKPRSDPSLPATIFLISATDTISGVDHYEISIDDGPPITWSPDATGEYHAPVLGAGTHEIVARAIDKAGNAASVRLSFAIEHLPAPTLTLSDKKFTEGRNMSGEIVSIPNGVATVFIEGSGETVQEEITLSGEGSASFVSTMKLSAGAYEVWVVARDARGAMSNESEHFTFEASASYIGVIKRHPLIPVVALLFIAFLFAMRFFWNKLHSADQVNEDDDVDDRVPKAGSHTAPVHQLTNGGTIVLTALKHKPTTLAVDTLPEKPHFGKRLEITK